MQTLFKNALGELVGTFILVFIGCSSVAIAVIFENLNLLQVASIWGAGVALAIFATRSYSPAHLNPAVTLAMVLTKNTPFKTAPLLIFAQFIGAIIAGMLVYFVFKTDIQSYENAHQLIRGSVESQKTAMIFGEFYPNPGNTSLQSLSTLSALFLEAIGTFVLVFVIFKVSSFKKLPKNAIPFIIGATVSVIICFVAPYTQAGLNPARDLGPRLVASCFGWGDAAYSTASLGSISVYVIGPFIGAMVACAVHLGIKKAK